MTKKQAQFLARKIIKMMEKGNIPWEKPWFNLYHKNPLSGTIYSGLNPLILTIDAHENDLKSNLWFTFKQIKQNDLELSEGWKNGKSTIHFKMKKAQRKLSGEELANYRKGRVKYPFNIYEEIDGQVFTFYRVTKFYNVVNGDYVKGYEGELKEIDQLKEPEKVKLNYLEKSGVKFEEGGNKAYYIPQLDQVRVPKIGQFKDSPSYYQAVFHELAHSTGTKKRLNRKELWGFSGFGSEPYAKEELNADLASSFLLHKCGVKYNRQNTASYLKNWLKVIKEDATTLTTAISKAYKIMEYIDESGLLVN